MATQEKDKPTLIERTLNVLAEKLTDPTSGEDAKQPINSAIAKCPKETNKIYIALTIDDGPLPRYTPHFVKFLDDNKIPATWYIVRSNIEEHIGDKYYQTLQYMQSKVDEKGKPKNYHEIAIHEAFPYSERNNTAILSEKMADPDHVNIFPSSNTNHPVFYNNVED